PLGVLAFIGLSLTLPRSRGLAASRFDFFGFITLSLGVGSLQLMMDRGQLLDWFASKEIVAYASVCAVSFYLFVIHILSYERPFLNMSLFKDRNFVASTV